MAKTKAGYEKLYRPRPLVWFESHGMTVAGTACGPIEISMTPNGQYRYAPAGQPSCGPFFTIEDAQADAERWFWALVKTHFEAVKVPK